MSRRSSLLFLCFVLLLSLGPSARAAAMTETPAVADDQPPGKLERPWFAYASLPFVKIEPDAPVGPRVGIVPPKYAPDPPVWSPVLPPDYMLADSDASRVTVMSAAGAFLQVVVTEGPGPITLKRWDVEPKDRLIALTFDDGPDPQNTPYILDLLRKHNAKATFFVLGKAVHKYPELLRQIVAEGHEIGNHGYTHQARHGTSFEAWVDEIERTKTAIRDASNVETTWYRSNFMFMSTNVVRASQKTSHRMVFWTVDPKDWRAQSAEQIASAVSPQSIKQGAVVLLHDGGGNRRHTIEALGVILDELAKRDFRCVTLSEIGAQTSEKPR